MNEKKQSMQLRSGSRLFRSASGECFLLKGYSVGADGSVLFSPDGKQFFEVLVTDQDIVADTFTFHSPHHNHGGTVRQLRRGPGDYYLEVNGEVFTKSPEALTELDDVVRLAQQMIYRLPTKSTLFMANNDVAILFAGKYETRMYSPDGKVFHEINELGSGPCGSDTRIGSPFHFSFVDGYDHGRTHDAWRQENVVVFDGDKIGMLRYTHPGNPHIGKPFVTINGSEFVLDDAVVARHGLKPAEVAANKPGSIRRIGNQLIIGGAVMHPVACPIEVSYLRLPSVRKPKYLYRLPDGQCVYVSVDVNSSSDESMRLYVGKADAMRNVTIRQVDYYRDGGTTNIFTDELVLHSPTPFDEGAQARWGKTTLTRLDPKKFDITESDNGPTISQKC